MRPITQAPLPRIRDIISCVIWRSSDEKLSKHWVDPNDRYFWFSKSAHSLAVIARCRQRYCGEIPIKVWVPAFFCDESLKALRTTGAELVFYALNEDLTPNIADCEMTAQTHKVDVFLHTHYFGEAIPANLSANFAKKYGAWLVEDAAHVLRATEGVGEFGDCVLYSPHKHLPIPDGAILVLKNDGIAKLGEDLRTIVSFQKIRDHYISLSEGSTLYSCVWLMKRVIQRLGIRKKSSNIKFYPNDLPVSKLASPRMSGLSKRLLSVLILNLDLVCARRKLHYQKWIDTMSWASIGSLNLIAPLNGTPYLVGFASSNGIEVQDIFESLSANGVDLPVSAWPDLPPEVMSKNHWLANKLRRTRLYLPVHQSLSTKSIEKYGVRTIKTLTQQWTTKNLSQSEWDLYWQKCSKANFLQSWQYGDAKAISGGWKSQRLLVLDHEDNPVAIVQVLTKTIPLVGGVARINRGPLLLESHTSEIATELSFAVLNVLIKEACLQRWWFLLVAPEIPSSESTKSGLKALGFRQAKTQPWASGLISLSTDEDAILMSFNGKWRNQMRKGIKLGVKVKKQDCSEATLDTLMRNYSALQKVKGFSGISDSLLKSLAQQKGSLWEFNLFFAYAESHEGGDPIGVLVSIRSSDTSTYLIGTSSDVGRSMQANAVLLWEAMVDAKNAGCEWYDIGGLNESTPRGIASFKKGLNAVPYNLVGEFYKFISPLN